VLTVVESFLLVGASFLIAAWPWLLSWFGLDMAAAVAATAVKWLVVVVALLASFAIAYYFGTNVKQEWQWITPGSTIGVLVFDRGQPGVPGIPALRGRFRRHVWDLGRRCAPAAVALPGGAGTAGWGRD
jgi:hypothetical protein